MEAELKVAIVRFVDEYQPGIVECRFTDADGNLHALIDKIPIFTDKDIWIHSQYPQPGSVLCEMLERWTDNSGNELVRIRTGQHDEFEIVKEQCEFTVFASQIATSIATKNHNRLKY